MEFRSLAGFAVGMTLMAASMALTPLAHAQDNVRLTGDVMVEKTVSVDGMDTVQLAPPTSVVPGDRLLFTTDYTNASAAPVDNFIITNPLPDAVMLAESGDFETSVDGGKTFAALDTLSIDDGSGTARSATPADVTHIRWTLARLAPGAQGQVRYHAIVR